MVLESGHGVQTQNKVRVTNAEWQDLTGRRHVQNLQALWMSKQNGPAVQQILNAVGTPCVSTLNEYNAYLTASLENMDTILDFYKALRWRRNSFDIKTRTKKAYSIVLWRITNTIRAAYPNRRVGRTVIFWGNGEFARGGSGYPTVPNKELVKHLKERFRVRITPERNTSAVCSNDGSATIQLTQWVEKMCTNNTCSSTHRRLFWNRDVNAARNIRDIGIFMNGTGGLRPYPFLPYPFRVGDADPG